MRALIIFCAVLAPIFPANAGDIKQSAEEGATYRFTVCEKPAAPAIDIDKVSKGKNRRKAVDVYNAYIDAVNDHFACIADEAQRDLDNYYNAVNGSLKARQDELLGNADALAEALKTAQSRPRRFRRAPLEDDSFNRSSPVRELPKDRKRDLDDLLLGGNGDAREEESPD